MQRTAFRLLLGHLPLWDPDCPDMCVLRPIQALEVPDLLLDLYYLAFPNDRRLVKSIAYFVYIIGTLQTAFALRDFYTLFCTPATNNLNEDVDLRTFGFMWLTIPVSSALGTWVSHYVFPVFFLIFVQLRLLHNCFMHIASISSLEAR